MLVAQTDRLRLRWLTPDDAPFVLELLNDPSWLQYIGDKHVRTVDDARAYISNEPMAMYRALGFGLNLVERIADAVPIGICGFKQRDGLEHPDLGFALLSAFHGQGYAREACVGIIAQTQRLGGTPPLLAITTAHNVRSIQLLEQLGLQFDKCVTLPGSSAELRLYRLN